MDRTTAGQHIRACERCNARYDWRKSTSGTLKMTFCSTLCERGALGFTLESMLNGTVVRVPRSREFRPLFPSWPIAA